MDYIVHEILQARILEWGAFPFSRGSSQPRDWTQVSRIARGFWTSWATREAPWRRGDTLVLRVGEWVSQRHMSALLVPCRIWGWWHGRADLAPHTHTGLQLCPTMCIPVQGQGCICSTADSASLVSRIIKQLGSTRNTHPSLRKISRGQRRLRPTQKLQSKSEVAAGSGPRLLHSLGGWLMAVSLSNSTVAYLLGGESAAADNWKASRARPLVFCILSVITQGFTTGRVFSASVFPVDRSGSPRKLSLWAVNRVDGEVLA